MITGLDLQLRFESARRRRIASVSNEDTQSEMRLRLGGRGANGGLQLANRLIVPAFSIKASPSSACASALSGLLFYHILHSNSGGSRQVGGRNAELVGEFPQC